MRKGRKSAIGALAAVMAVSLAVGAAFALPVWKTADAARSTTAWVNVDEIYNDKNHYFKVGELKKLYQALAGSSVTTIAELENALSGKDALTSADFRKTNSGSKNVSVEFGGVKWDAVYLTKARNGDIILDLWQSADDNLITSKWAERGTGEEENARSDNPDALYPDNLYSTSLMRVKTLNAGGYYSTTGSTLSEKVEQDPDNLYHRFTMTNVDDSLTAFLVKPSGVAYQETENNIAINSKVQDDLNSTSLVNYTLVNDAYGTPSGETKSYNSRHDYKIYEGKGNEENGTNYTAWQDDYLWLPSYTEVGGCNNCVNDIGLWETDASLRSTILNGTDTTSQGFLRSGWPTRAYSVWRLSTTGETGTTVSVSSNYYVRPAIHLNLTAAAKAAAFDEIYDDESKSFNTDNLNALYKALTGTESFGDVKSAAEKTTTSDAFRSNNGGINVSFVFGGIRWDATYLTKATNGDVILDLWQSADNITLTSKWADRTSAANNPTDTYPDNLYSTSLIRVQALNAGGQYSTSSSALSGNIEQNSGSIYARFTMSSVSNSLTAYIAKPSEVGYQEKEFDATTARAFNGSNHYAPNDAYGTPSGGAWADSKYDYSGKANYDAWKDDYLWLPSITETGCGNNGTGMWNTDVLLRNSGGTAVWLRSGDDNWAANAYTLEPTGNNQHYYVNYEYAVRPALHLNLSAINRTFITPVSVPSEPASKTYNGNWQTSGIKETEYYSVKEANDGKGGMNAGTYDVVLTLNDKDSFVWEDTRDAEDKTLTFQIIKAMDNAWTGGKGKEVTLASWVYGDTGPHTPAAPSVYGSDKVTFSYYNDDGDKPNSFPLSGQPKNAGTYWVKATLADTDNYNGLDDVQVQFIIKKKEITTIKWTGGPYTYTGSVITEGLPAATFDGVGGDGVGIPLSVKQITEGEFKDAKEYTFEASLTEAYAKNYTPESPETFQKTIVIKKATNAWTSGGVTVEDGGWTYSEEGTVSAPSTFGNAKFNYFKDNGGVAGDPLSEQPKDAGTYWVQATVEADKENYDKITSALVQFIIKKKEITELSWTKEEEYPYIGNPYTNPTASFQGVGAEIGDIALDVAMKTKPEGAAANELRNAGDYTFEASLPASYQNNYDFKPTSAALSITITPKKITAITWQKAKSFPYEGKALDTPTATFTGEGMDGEISLVVSLKDTSKIFQDVGKYIFQAKLSADADRNYDMSVMEETFEIEAVPLFLTWTGGASHSYEYGSAVPPAASIVASGIKGSDKDKLSVAVEEVSGKSFVAVGSYSYTATLGGDAKDNYYISNPTQQYTITPAKLNASLSASVVYGDTIGSGNVTVSVNAEDLKNGDAKTAIETEIKNKVGEAFKFTGYTEGTQVGSTDAKVSADPVTIENYTVSFPDAGAVTIEKREIVLSLSGEMGGKPENIYGAEQHGKITASATRYGKPTDKWFGIASDEALLGDELAYTFRKDGASVAAPYAPNMGVGEYTITAKWAENSTLSANYKIVNEDTGAVYTVQKATLTVTANEHSVEYGKEPSGNSGVTITGFQNNEREEEVVSGEPSYEYNYTKDQDVGDYLITPVQNSLAAANYTFAFESGKLIVTPKEISVTFPERPKNLLYGKIEGSFSAELDGVVNGDDVTVKLTYSGNANDGTAISGETMPTLAGKYQVKADLDGTEVKNYTLNKEGSWLEFTIERAAVERPTADPTEFVYNGEKQTYTVGGDTEHVTVEGYEQKDANEEGYPVTVSLSDDKNYIWAGENEDISHMTFSFIIKKKEIESIDWGEETFTYEGRELSPAAAFEGVGDDAGDPIALNVAVLSGDAFRNVGEYTFQVTLNADHGKNYKLKEADTTHRYQIEKATLEVTWSGVQESYTYSGSPFAVPTAAATGVGEDADKLEFTVDFDEASPRKDAFMNAGEYIFVATIQGGLAENYELTNDTTDTITIEKATVKEPDADGTEFLYTGVEQEYTVSPSDLYTVSGNRQTNADSYTVTIALTDKENYKWETADGDLYYDFVIGKATLTVKAKDKEITYGDAPSNNGVTFSGFVNDEDEEVLVGTLAYSCDYEQYDDVGGYAITPSGLSADNYDIQFVAGTLKVNAKAIEVKWDAKSYTYTGSVFTDLPTATAEGIGEDGTFALKVSPAFTGEFKNAGSYVFKATLDSANAKAKNYTLTGDTKSYTVDKQTLTAPKISSKVYNGAKQTADVEDSALYDVTQNDGGINAGSYDVELTLSDSANYKWEGSENAEITLTFTITKANYDMSGVKFEGLTLTYDAKEHSILIEGTLPNGVTVTYEGNGKKAVGEYTVTANFTGDEQNYHEIPSMTASLNILAVSHDLSEVGFEDVTVKYDGAAHSISIEGTLPTGVTVTYEGNGQIDPDIYTVTAVFHDPDGVFDRKTATLTILRLQTQTDVHEQSGSADVVLDSAEGFDPTLELVVEKAKNVERTYLMWERDAVSDKYAVRMCKDGVEVPFDGTVTVRLLIPEEFRDRDFELRTVTRSENVAFTRDGDYVIFEADGLSAYVFACDYTPYFPVIILISAVLFVDVLGMAALVFVRKKRKNRTEE